MIYANTDRKGDSVEVMVRVSGQLEITRFRSLVAALGMNEWIESRQVAVLNGSQVSEPEI